MPAFASAALATAVVLSGLGAVMLCILVVLYGFAPSDEDSPARTSRRLVVTRLGHAVAAACFTATAILIAIVLVQPSPTPPPAAVPVAAPDARVPALGEKVAGQETRLTETEARIRELQDALRRRDADEARPVVQRPAPAPPRQRPVATEPKTPAAARSAVPAPARPSEEMAPPEPSAPAASPRAADPPAPRPSPAGPAPAIAPALATPPSAPVAVAPPRPAPSEAASPPAASRPVPRRGVDLPNKLRDDWREIQRGVDSAGDDFRSAVDSLKRRLLGN